MSPVVHRDWLVHTDRTLWPAWLAAQATAVHALADHGEVGEHIRHVTLSCAAGAEPLLAHGIARAAMPVQLRLPRRALLEAGSTARRQLADLATEHGATTTVAVAVRRQGARVAEMLSTATAIEERARVQRGAIDDESRAVLLVAVSDDTAYAGVTTFAACGSPYAVGVMPELRAAAPHDATSRARYKLRESLAWLAAFDRAGKVDGTWLDLGAFPGGMTRELVEHGCAVLAVDLADGAGVFADLSPRARYIRADATTFAPDPTPDRAPYLRGIVCDMNGTPARAAAAVARLAPLLLAGGYVVHTIKLPAMAAAAAIVSRTRHTLAAAGITTLVVRHQCFNRCELTLLGRHIPAS